MNRRTVIMPMGVIMQQEYHHHSRNQQRSKQYNERLIPAVLGLCDCINKQDRIS